MPHNFQNLFHETNIKYFEIYGGWVGLFIPVYNLFCVDK